MACCIAKSLLIYFLLVCNFKVHCFFFFHFRKVFLSVNAISKFITFYIEGIRIHNIPLGITKTLKYLCYQDQAYQNNRFLNIKQQMSHFCYSIHDSRIKCLLSFMILTMICIKHPLNIYESFLFLFHIECF